MSKNSTPHEHAEQVTFVSQFEIEYPDIRILAIPNGSHRHKAVAAKLKAEGVRRGAPDLLIPAWRLWVEMKRQKGGRISIEQKEWIAYLESIGHFVIVGRGWEDAMAQVKAHIKNFGLL